MIEAAEEWDARAEYALGQFILQYVAQQPAPAGSRIGEELERLGRMWNELGQDDLARLGSRRLAAMASLDSEPPRHIALEEKRKAWKKLPVVEKSHQILNVVDDTPRSIADIAKRLSDHAGTELAYCQIAHLVRDLVTAGDLVKVNLGGSGGRTSKWGYMHDRALSGEIAALERSLQASAGTDERPAT